jgi:hypothetical protein
VAKPEGVADLLARHQMSPAGRVVRRGVEVCIIHLGGTLHDVPTANPDRSQTEPAVPAILRVADLYPPTRRIASLRVCAVQIDTRLEHIRILTPVVMVEVTRSGCQVRLPVC